MLYLLKNGCSWRDLPGEFPPWPSVNGRKRHLMVEGLPVEVTAANVSDQAGAKLLLSGKKDEWPRLKLLWVDGAYDGVAEWALEEGGWVLEVVHKLAEKGFHVLPRRWVVERTFAWLMKCRRLVRDFERLIETVERFIYSAMVRLVVRRLAA